MRDAVIAEFKASSSPISLTQLSEKLTNFDPLKIMILVRELRDAGTIVEVSSVTLRKHMFGFTNRIRIPLYRLVV